MNETLSKNVHRILLGNCLHYQHDERSDVLGHPRVLLRSALGQRQGKWRNFYQASGGKVSAVYHNRFGMHKCPQRDQLLPGE
jgi:hypothetical protein